MGWLKSLYFWTLKQAERPRALVALFLVSLAESSFFPVPPDLLIAPIVLARRAWWWLAALICTVGSVLGGLIGYAIGRLAFDQIGQPLLNLIGQANELKGFEETFRAFDWQIVFLAGFTPIPYKVFTLASGAFEISVPVFIAASVLARGSRFFLVAGLFALFGPRVRPLIERHFGCFPLAAGLVLVLAVVIYMRLH